MKNKVLLEITDFCFDCPIHEKCIEEKCVLFRIEKIICKKEEKMKLMTKELEKKFEKYPLYSQDGMGGKAKVLVKYFNPVGAGTWLITEGNKLENGDYEMFGYCHLGDDDFAELGYVMLSELENITLFGGLKIERDLYLADNITLYDAMKKSGMKIPDFLNVNLKKELNVNSLVNNFEVPLVIEEYLDLSLDDLENDLYLKKICPDSRNKLVYCDNDICYYDCFDGDYLCIETKDAIKMKENHVHNNSGLIRLNELNSNEISIDYGGKRIKDIAEKYKTRDSIKYNSYITAKFKSIIDKQVITNDLRYVESCAEYESLKESLNDEDLIKINNVIKDFTFYENSYDDGERDIIGEYEGRYGNYNIIEWYEGLKSTKFFLEDFKLERDDYSV